MVPQHRSDQRGISQSKGSVVHAPGDPQVLPRLSQAESRYRGPYFHSRALDSPEDFKSEGRG